MALDTNLISWYKLDETSGTTAEDELGTNDGTNNGATVNQTGKLGTAYSFDGDYVDLGFNRQSVPISFSLWVYPTTLNTWHCILANRIANSSQSTSFALRLADVNLYIDVGDQEIDTGYNLTTGSWHHIVLTIDENSVKVYVNGSEEYSSTSYGTDSTATDNFRIGQGFTQSFIGTIDEVGIWSKVLSSTEIEELYNSGDGLTYPFGSSYTQTCSESFSTTGILRKTPNKLNQESFNFNDGDNKIFYKNIMEVFNFNGLYSKDWEINRGYSESFNFNDLYSKGINKEHSETFNFNDLYSKTWGINREYSETFNIGSIGDITEGPSVAYNDTSVGDNGWISKDNVLDPAIVSALVRTSNDLSNVFESEIKIIKGGIIGSENKSTGALLPTTRTDISYGGTSDKWGETWKASDINSSDFGVAFSVTGEAYTSNYLKVDGFGFDIPTASNIDGILVEIRCNRNTAYAYASYIQVTVYYSGSDSVTKSTSRNIYEEITLSDEIIGNIFVSLLLLETMNLSDSLYKRLVKNLSEELNISDVDVKRIYRILLNSLNLNEDISKNRIILRSYLEEIGLSDECLRKFMRNLSEEINLSDGDISSIINLLFDESFNFSDKFLKIVYDRLMVESTRNDIQQIITTEGIQATLIRQTEETDSYGKITSVAEEEYAVYIAAQDILRSDRQLTDMGTSVPGSEKVFMFHSYPDSITGNGEMVPQVGDMIKDDEDIYWRIEQISAERYMNGSEIFKSTIIKKVDLT